MKTAQYQIEYWDKQKIEWIRWNVFSSREEAVAYKRILDLNCHTRIRKIEA